MKKKKKRDVEEETDKNGSSNGEAQTAPSEAQTALTTESKISDFQSYSYLL